MAALTDIWNAMKPASRASAVVLALLIVVAAVAAASWALSDRHETLFSSMEPQDAAAVIAELERMGIAYELSEGGSRIAVPAEQVHEIRVKLMGSGVPLRGGVGFEIFDESGFGMTEFAQKINYQRALEGELSRTITALKEVKYARVHLVMPESSLFRKQEATPSASVTLFMKPGAVLDEARIAGLQRLVAAAVPGLSTKGVTVSDQNGVSLSRPMDHDEGSLAVTTRLQKKQEIEAYFSGKVASVLDRALGPGQAIVSVDVSLDLNQVRTTREEVIPHGNAQDQVLRRRESKSSGGAPDSSSDTVTEVEYRLGRQVEQIVMTPGAIERLSIGVLVPEQIAADRVQEIRTLVAMAVGLNDARGDAIAVFATSFDSAGSKGVVTHEQTLAPPAGEQPASPEKSFSATGLAELMKHPEAGLAAAVLVLVLVAVFLVARRSGPRPLRPEERIQVLKQLEQWTNGKSATLEKGQP